MGSTKNRWCVFTSAGDHHNVAAWSDGWQDRPWDLIVAFYGENEFLFSRLAQTATAAFRSKGSKFQNLKKIFAKQPNLFKNYEYIWVVDDDILIAPSDIEKLFAISAEYGFWVAQPAFSWEGRVSHPITTRAELYSDIRIVNFVEVTAPLFQRERLEDFLGVYDGELAGWGVDWWFCNYLCANQNRRFAIIDKVLAINPADHQRTGGVREILKLQSDEDRCAHWLDVAARFHLQEYEMRVLSRIVEDAALNF